MEGGEDVVMMVVRKPLGVDRVYVSDTEEEKGAVEKVVQRVLRGTRVYVYLTEVAGGVNMRVDVGRAHKEALGFVKHMGVENVA